MVLSPVWTMAARYPNVHSLEGPADAIAELVRGSGDALSVITVIQSQDAVGPGVVVALLEDPAQLDPQRLQAIHAALADGEEVTLDDASVQLMLDRINELDDSQVAADGAVSGPVLVLHTTEPGTDA